MTHTLREDLPKSLVSRMEGPEPPPTFESNGCTMAPDWWGGIDIRPACHWHDWSYDLGGNEHDRQVADSRFYRNLRACDLSRWKANLYYYRVRFWGVDAFKYVSLSMKPTGWARFKTLLTRYVRW